MAEFQLRYFRMSKRAWCFPWLWV